MGLEPAAVVWAVLPESDRMWKSRSSWLSNRVDSVRAIRDKRELPTGLSLSERLNYWLHTHHTWKSSLLIFVEWLGVLLLIAIGSELIAFFFQEPRVSDPMWDGHNVLGSISQVLAGAASILLAIVIFGLQFGSQRLESSVYLLRYVRRREGFIPLAAITFSIAAANALGAILGFLGWHNAGTTLLWCDFVLLPLALVAILWLTYRLAVIVSEPLWESARAGLTWELKNASYEDQHYSFMIAEYTKVLDSCALKYQPGADLFNLDRIRPLRCKLSRRGRITDIDVTALRRLALELRKLCPDYEPVLTLAPGDMSYSKDANGALFDNSAVLLQAGRDESRDLRTTVSEPDEYTKQQIQAVVDRLFAITPLEQSDVFRTIEKFEEGLLAEAATLSGSRLQQVLAIQLDLVEMKLDYKQRTSGYSFHRDQLSGPLDYRDFELAHSIGDNGPADAIGQLVWHAYRIMASALSHRDADLFSKAGQYLEVLYLRALHRTPQMEKVADSAIKRLAVLEQFAFQRWHLGGFQVQEVEAEWTMLVSAISLIVDWVKECLKLGREADASRLLRRLWHWDLHAVRSKRHLRKRTESDVPAVMRKVYDFHSAATTVIAAWCLHVFREGGPDAKAAGALFSDCLSQLGGREDVMRVWLTVSRSLCDRGTLARCLGAEHWTVPYADEFGTGGLSFGQSDEWCWLGFLALLLARPGVPARELQGSQDAHGMMIDLTRIEEECRSILADGDVRIDLLKIEEAKQDDAVAAVRKLFSDLLCTYKRNALQAVITGNLDAGRCDRVASEIREALTDHRRFPSAANSLGIPLGQPIALPYPRPVVQFQLWKETLLPSSRTSMGLGSNVSGSVAQQEAIRVCYMLERNAEPFGSAKELGDLPNLIQKAERRINDRGFVPNLLLIPSQTRFEIALTQKEAWQWPGHGALGHDHIGHFGSLEVFVWPYESCSSVVLVDARRFFTNLSLSEHERVSVLVSEPDQALHAAMLEKAMAETDPDRIPAPSEVQLWGLVSILPGMGIAEPAAALRIDLPLITFGFALQPGETVYHRPRCPSIVPDKEKHYSMGTRLKGDTEDRTPCDKCKPDEWAEGEEGAVQP